RGIEWQLASPASFLPGEKRKSKLREGPPAPRPPGIGGWDRGYFASMKAGLFCVCESRFHGLVSIPPLTNFFSDPSHQASMLRVTLQVSLHNKGNQSSHVLIVSLFKSLIINRSVASYASR